MKHVCSPATDNTPYLCQHTLSPLLILPLILCVTPLTMHKLSVIPTYTAFVWVYALCMHAHRDVCIFPSHLKLLAQMWSVSFLSSQLKVAISSPWKPVWSSNWQIDLHDFDCNFFFPVVARALVFKFVCTDLSEVQ